MCAYIIPELTTRHDRIYSQSPARKGMRVVGSRLASHLVVIVSSARQEDHPNKQALTYTGYIHTYTQAWLVVSKRFSRSKKLRRRRQRCVLKNEPPRGETSTDRQTNTHIHMHALLKTTLSLWLSSRNVFHPRPFSFPSHY